MMSISRIRKALVAVVGLAAIAAAELPPDAPVGLQRWAPVVIGVATVLGVYGVRNQQPQPPELPPKENRKALFQSPSEKPELRTEPPAKPPTSRVGQVYDQTRKPPTR